MLRFWLILALGGLFSAANMAAVKLYQQRSGKSVSACGRLQMLSGAAVFLFFLGKISLTTGRFSLGLTPYTVCIAVIYTFFSFSAYGIGIKAVSCGNLALFSMFAVLGGMLVPTAAGIVFYRETVTVGKGIGMALMLAAVVLPSAHMFRQKSDTRAALLYIAAFVVYGAGALAVLVHQNPGSFPAAPADGFLSLYGFVLLLMGSVVRMTARPDTGALLVGRRTGVWYAWAPWLLPIFSGLVVGLANYMSMLSLAPGGVGAVVSSSVLNAFTMSFTYLVSILAFGEKATGMQIFATVLAVVSAALFAF